MEQSILVSIRDQFPIAEGDTTFDSELIMHINTALFTLTQLGIGPDEGYSIEDKNDLWSDFLPEGRQLEAAKTYVYLSTKLGFDPPTSSSLLDAIERQMRQLEWRLNIAVDPGESREE